MAYIATITSKRQLTIPSELFKKTKLSKGDKVYVEEKDGNIVLKPATSLIDELAGSVVIPDRLKGVDIDEVLQLAKKNYFTKRAK